MGRQELQYPVEPYSKGHRYDKFIHYSLRTIHSIINDTRLLHISFTDPNSPFPAVLPMIGQMGSFDRPSSDLGDVLDLYIHGYISARLFNVTRKDGSDKGLPVTISASQVDSLIMSLTPYTHSYGYKSAVLFGHATVVTDPEERAYAMELITDGIVPTRWKNTRTPPTPAELQSTSVLRVRIATGSAKIGAGMPKDSREDAADEPLKARVWTGVVPVYQTLGAPVPSGYNKAPLPSYLAEYIQDTNAAAVEAAQAALREPDLPKRSEEEN